MSASAISSTTVRHRHNSTGGSGSGGAAHDPMAEDEDSIVGHCAIGLEQLCKVAMVSSGGTSGYITVSRLLVNRGRPMFNMDPKTMQVRCSKRVLRPAHFFFSLRGKW